MSGKIGTNCGFVSKAEFGKLQAKVDSLVTRLRDLETKSIPPPAASPSSISNRKFTGGVKSWLYSKGKAQRPSLDTSQNCDKPETGRHIYHRHHEDEGGHGVTEVQRQLRNEFNQLQADITKDIKSLQKSVRDIQDSHFSLEAMVRASVADLQRSMDMLAAKLGGSDRPVSSVSKLKPEGTLREVLRTDKSNNGFYRESSRDRLSSMNHHHSFEWEVGNITSLTRNQKEACSQPYLIEDLGYRISGGVTGFTDGHLRLKVCGELLRSSKERRNGKAEYLVYGMHPKEKQQDWLLGHWFGSLFTDKDLVLGDVYLSELMQRGFVNEDGSLTLSFVVQITS